MADLVSVERMLCERYNVREIDGPLKVALDAADVATLKELLMDRALYRWQEPIEQALAIGGEPEVPTEAEPEVEAEEPVEQPAPIPARGRPRRR